MEKGTKCVFVPALLSTVVDAFIARYVIANPFTKAYKQGFVIGGKIILLN